MWLIRAGVCGVVHTIVSKPIALDLLLCVLVPASSTATITRTTTTVTTRILFSFALFNRSHMPQKNNGPQKGN
jgi:hypothetical protein